METIEAKRFLVRSLFDGERTCQLRLVDLTGPELSVKPFETETAATVFIDARVVLLDRELVERDGITDLDSRLMFLGRGDVAASGLYGYLAIAARTPADCVIAVAY